MPFSKLLPENKNAFSLNLANEGIINIYQKQAKNVPLLQIIRQCCKNICLQKIFKQTNSP